VYELERKIRRPFDPAQMIVILIREILYDAERQPFGSESPLLPFDPSPF
jgi:hypothetical protein